MNSEYTETPDETDFPLIDRCVQCDSLCEWQPRYEIAVREYDHMLHLQEQRPLDYTPTHRVVKFCVDCIPDDNDELRRLIRRHYPLYARENRI